MKLRQGHLGDDERVREAIVLLRRARTLLSVAGARKSAERVRRALKSAEGAERHVQRLPAVRRRAEHLGSR